MQAGDASDGFSVVVGAVIEIVSMRALLKAAIKISLEDHTLEIFFLPRRSVAGSVLHLAHAAHGIHGIAQFDPALFSHAAAVPVVVDAHAFDIPFAPQLSHDDFVILAATEIVAAVMIDVELKPRYVAEYVFIGHVHRT